MNKTAEGEIKQCLSKNTEQSKRRDDEINTILRQQIRFDPENKSQFFYKTYYRQFKNQVLLKHGYKIFSISREQEDLVRFCLCLLQSQAKFPLKFLFYPREESRSDQQYDVWAQTQFLISCNTQQRDSTSQNEQFQKNIYKFFNDHVIPNLKQFKENKMSWEYMVSADYTDEKVVQQFSDKIVNCFNNSFKELCRAKS